VHVADVPGIHADEIVVGGIVGPGQLSGGFTRAADSYLAELFPGPPVDRVAGLLGTGGSGCDLEPGFQTGFFHHILHDKFSHGAAADVAVADKQDFYHFLITPYMFCISSQMLDFAGFLGLFHSPVF